MPPRRTYHHLVETGRISQSLHHQIMEHSDRERLMRAAESIAKTVPKLDARHVPHLTEFVEGRSSVQLVPKQLIILEKKRLPKNWSLVTRGQPIVSNQALKVIRYDRELVIDGERVQPYFYIEKKESDWRINADHVSYYDRGKYIPVEKRNPAIVRKIIAQLRADLKN